MTHNGFWGSYAIGLLQEVTVGDDVVAYLEGIDATLTPFGGRFLVHGATVDQVEGTAVGDVVVIAFPEPDGAAAWYHSPAYQAIVALRTDNSRSQVVLLPGAEPEHRATDVLTALLGT